MAMDQYLQCEAPKIAKLVNITPITRVYCTQITIVTGANLNQLTTGGPHIVYIYINTFFTGDEHPFPYTSYFDVNYRGTRF